MYLSPKDIVVDFLRKNVSDPRNRISTNSDSFTSILNQDSFTLSPTSGKTLSYVDSVTVDGTTKVKWRDYYIDFKAQRIVFFTGIASGLSVNVSYGESSSDWIYPDKPNKKLDADKFPRMNVLIIGNPGTRLGNYNAPVEAVPRFQVDIWTKEKQDNQIFLINDRKYTGADLAEYLSYQITKAFENSEEDLIPALYSYDPVGMPPDLPFDEELQCHHKVVEFILRGLDLGRIS